MSNSLLNKGNAVINAIAITAALAIISGALPIQPVSLAQLQSSLQVRFYSGQE